MTDADFMRAILADPDDDTPRLVYADWLDERAGGYSPRAELIRVQCELARDDYFDRDGLVKSNLRLSERAYDLLSRWCQSWLPPRFDRNKISGVSRPKEEGGGIPTAVDVHFGPPSSIRFRRGFVGEAWLSTVDWLAFGCGLVQAAPIREVRLTDKRPTQFSWGNGGSYWRWFSTGHYGITLNDDPDELPECLWKVYARLNEHYEHATEADAVAALSQTCLHYARRRAKAD